MAAIKFFRGKGKRVTVLSNDVHLSSRKRIGKVRKEDVSLRYYALLEVDFDFQSDAFSIHLQSREHLLVPVREVGPLSPVVSRAAVSLSVCPPVRQVGPLSLVVSRAAVSVPASVRERQVGLVSRHRPHVLV